MEPQNNKQSINWKKTICTTSFKTLLVLFILLIILFLDALIIRGAYLGIQYVGEQISSFFSEVSQRQEEKREAEMETAETTKDLKELLKEEQEALDKIFEQQDK